MRLPWALAVVVLALVGLGGCGGDGDDSPGGDRPTEGSVPDAAGDGDPEVEPLTAPPPGLPPAGRARVALGRTLDAELEVTTCELDPAPDPAPDREEVGAPRLLIEVVAEGSGEDGTPLRLEVTRFVASGEAVTVTDTVTVTEGPVAEPDRVRQAQRFEVAGQVTDGRDPDASAPLLSLRGATVEAEGRFAPPGHFAGDGGLVQGAVAITCRS